MIRFDLLRRFIFEAADRLPCRLVLLCADSGRMLTVLSIAVLIWLHLLQIWHLFVLAILFGLCRSFFHPAYRAITPGSRATLRSYASKTGRQTTIKLAFPVLDAHGSRLA